MKHEVLNTVNIERLNIISVIFIVYFIMPYNLTYLYKNNTHPLKSNITAIFKATKSNHFFKLLITFIASSDKYLKICPENKNKTNKLCRFINKYFHVIAFCLKSKAD